MNRKEQIELILIEFRKVLENLKILVENNVMVEDETQSKMKEIDNLKNIIKKQQDRINELQHTNNSLLDLILDLETLQPTPEYF